MSLPTLLTTAEAAAALRKTPRAFLKWAAKKQIAGYAEGRQLLWQEKTVWEAFTRRQEPQLQIRRVK